MSISTRFTRPFFAQDTLKLARDLLGQRLVRIEDGDRTAGIIIEAEAYHGESDQGCHAKAGLTSRTRVMYGPPGHAYVYFTYGMHWMLNFVAGKEGFPAAVLIRAIYPTEGIERISARRPGRARAIWTDGPGKICQALAINRALNGHDLCAPQAELFVENGLQIPESSVTISPRVGLNNVPEPWKSMPWRFRVRADAVRSMLGELCPLSQD